MLISALTCLWVKDTPACSPYSEAVSRTLLRLTWAQERQEKTKQVFSEKVCFWLQPFCLPQHEADQREGTEEPLRYSRRLGRWSYASHTLYSPAGTMCKTAELLSPWVKSVKTKKSMGEIQWSSLPITALSPTAPPSHNLQWWAVSTGPLLILLPSTQMLSCMVIFPHRPKLKSDELFPEIRTAKSSFKVLSFVLKLLAQIFVLHLPPVQWKMQ